MVTEAKRKKLAAQTRPSFNTALLQWDLKKGDHISRFDCIISIFKSGFKLHPKSLA